MTAPVLLLVMPLAATGQATIAAHRLRQRLAREHPHVETAISFAGSQTAPATPPEPKPDWSEVVLVPVDLTHLKEPPESVRALAELLSASHPDLAVRISRPLGPAPALLGVIDDRMRMATHRAHTQEIDALVLSSPDAGDRRGSTMLSRMSRMWSQHHHIPVRQASGSSGALHVAEVVHSLRREGRRHVAVGSLWVSISPESHEHDLAALEAGAEVVSAPIGDDVLLAQWAFERYCSAAMGSVAEDPGGD
ncbi:sirohydrochlorin chelatase [Acidipropionibacterium jensenii]|uniref:Cobalamin biosynthesis protein CbiX n=2 Tax=Acidipropionibacterium jensenii TaxID=1749 RepID=A0A3S4YMI4_9ACTN|nr:hypothetical protein [Acidipropionibacterium jensenii]MDN6557205.1 cobalamin biosynthesis protein CbiX [Acidipropionibacterium acidipropionici]AZZ39533.1 cobalamin biosynthesis protein CbiX [Acidipropionibacterium jensenii]MDN5995322.1 cobalamin biosynthesis protein CbiX [Acidipropionibacterium jensenii]MDN6440421.1 cobalamin biosynthesis protein CbiX [Acidipropionibacterium jensenii]MDN6481012.1 cobalamin biosynthesis protein CbiX [Acidipropionibacterium jensenii]